MKGKQPFSIIFKTLQKNWNCFTRFYLFPKSPNWKYPKLTEETFTTYGKKYPYAFNSYPRKGYQVLVKLASRNKLKSAWNLEMDYFLKNNDMLDLIILNSKVISSSAEHIATRITGIEVVEFLVCCRHCSPSGRTFVKYGDDSFVPSLTSLEDEMETKHNKIINQAKISIRMPYGRYKPDLPRIVPVLNHERFSSITASEDIVKPGQATISDFILSILLNDVNASAQYVHDLKFKDRHIVSPNINTASEEDYRIVREVKKYSFLSCGRNYNIKISLMKLFLAFDMLQIEQGSNILSNLNFKVKLVTAGLGLASLVLTEAFRGDNFKNIVATASTLEMGILGSTTTFASDISARHYDKVITKLIDQGVSYKQEFFKEMSASNKSTDGTCPNIAVLGWISKLENIKVTMRTKVYGNLGMEIWVSEIWVWKFGYKEIWVSEVSVCRNFGLGNMGSGIFGYAEFVTICV
ncbi:hypothetical protein Fcan01_22677 [Folsomia candida]|uniref:Uncharacterized protein n=1 Tax=Folsomia candida TaxID=158441 RepID=A0A226DBD5_FOLCA|nr:hypothetical protein Fcan01_22677 [Folsomia candida]